jgi:lauroyl/myristoyl acyltransferase
MMPWLLRDPLWWRCHVGNRCLAALPLAWQYRIAEDWGRCWASRRDEAEAVRRGAALLYGHADPPRDREIARRFLGLQSRIRLDDHRMATAPVAEVVAQVQLDGADALVDAMAQQRGLIVLTAHFGRLGMIGPALRKAGMKSAFLSATVDERAPDLPAMQRWIGQRNGRSLQRFLEGPWIMADDPATRLRAVLRRGEALIVVLDALSSRSPHRDRFRFGPGSIRIPTGIGRLAEATGAALAMALLRDIGGERVAMCCRRLPDAPVDALQAAFDMLAVAVWDAPWQWWLLPHAAALWEPDSGSCIPT